MEVLLNLPEHVSRYLEFIPEDERADVIISILSKHIEGTDDLQVKIPEDLERYMEFIPKSERAPVVLDLLYERVNLAGDVESKKEELTEPVKSNDMPEQVDTGPEVKTVAAPVMDLAEIRQMITGVMSEFLSNNNNIPPMQMEQNNLPAMGEDSNLITQATGSMDFSDEDIEEFGDLLDLMK